MTSVTNYTALYSSPTPFTWYPPQEEKQVPKASAPALGPAPAGNQAYFSIYAPTYHEKLFDIVAKRLGVELVENGFPSKNEYLHYVSSNPELSMLSAVEAMEDYLSHYVMSNVELHLKNRMFAMNLIYTPDAFELYAEWKRSCSKREHMRLWESINTFCEECGDLFRRS